MKTGKNIPFNQGFLICRVQKLLIRSLHWKVSDWDLRKSSPDRATDWNKWSIAKWHHNTLKYHNRTRKKIWYGSNIKQKASCYEIKNLEPSCLTKQVSIKAQGWTEVHSFLIFQLKVLQATLGTCVTVIYNNVETLYETVLNVSIAI